MREFAKVFTAIMAITIVVTSADADIVPSEVIRQSGISGGLIVHLGCGDGSGTLKLKISDAWLVRGLDTDPKNVETARRKILQAGQYGPVSVDLWTGKLLPFVDNSVNLIVSGAGCQVSEEEVRRVLAPRGVAVIGGKKIVKPVPTDTDEWTHSLYDASGNAVSRDMVVGPPKGLQWKTGPKWTRHHEAGSSFHAMVSANGRVFYLLDEGPRVSLFLPSSWNLIARDAYNGKLLWKRPFKKWVTQLFPHKSGPIQMNHRIVAAGDRLYVAANLDEGVTVVDAATGETVRYLENTAATEEILHYKGLLYLVTTDKPFLYQSGDRFSEQNVWSGQEKWIRAVNPETGKELWKIKTPVAPMSFGVNEYGVFFHNGANIIRLEGKTGKTIWESVPVLLDDVIPPSNPPTLVLYKDVVLYLGGKDGEYRGPGWFVARNLSTLTSLSAETGKILWTSKSPPCGFECPKDVLVIDDLIWAGAILSGRVGDKRLLPNEVKTFGTGIFSGVNIHTGKVEREFKPPWDVYWFHQRCHRSRATERYIIPGRTGIEFVSPKTGWESYNHWVRGTCLYGIMPANGYIYQPQHPCGCYMAAMLHGFNALSPVANGNDTEPVEFLEKGPAFSEDGGQGSEADRDQWPTFRHDAARSGSTQTELPEKLKEGWSVKVGENLSAITVSGGRVFVSDKDSHTVCALDSGTGKLQWRYTAGARVDSPPSIAMGRALFGSRDGYLYCLNAADGKLAWRYRVARDEKYLVADDQLESVWPLHGSPLVIEDRVYTVAGRSMFLDKGLRFICLDIATGRKIHDQVLDQTDPLTGGLLQDKIQGNAMPTANPDILSCNGRNIFMGMQKFNMDGTRPEIVTARDPTDQEGEDAHLFTSGGFLDDSGFHRIQMLYGKVFTQGFGGVHAAPRHTPAGKMLAFNDKHVFGFSRQPHLHTWVRELAWHIYRTGKPGVPQPPGSEPEKSPPGNSKGRNRKVKTTVRYHWSHGRPDLYVNSMVLAKDALFVAGPPAMGNDMSTDALSRWQGQKGGLLRVLSTGDGKKLSELTLVSPPVYEGMAAAYGRLFVALQDGSVVCLK